MLFVAVRKTLFSLGVCVDRLNDALVSCIKACGGSKAVAPLLWPEKTPEAAQRLLLDCMNDDRPAHLSNEAMLMVLRMAHGRGCHHGMAYLCERTGYAQPVPITPVDEAAELQRDFVAATEVMAVLVAKMERLQSAMAPVKHQSLRAA